LNISTVGFLYLIVIVLLSLAPEPARHDCSRRDDRCSATFVVEGREDSITSAQSLAPFVCVLQPETLVVAFYGALPATTPMLATVSPFFIEGTAQTYRTTPLDGARASQTVLPKRSVT
jgi:hypothetical protein